VDFAPSAECRPILPERVAGVLVVLEQESMLEASGSDAKGEAAGTAKKLDGG
jgi:hypothetical protein